MAEIHRFTFFFACWVANKKLPDDFISMFNKALKYGLDNRSALIDQLISTNQYSTNIHKYLNESISYNYDLQKKQALQLFLNYLATPDSQML